MHAVPLDVFESKIHSIRTYHDVLRIFYGNHILTDDIIDTMMMEDHPQYFHTPYGTMVGFSPVRQPAVMSTSDRDTQAHEAASNSRRDKGKGISSDVLHDSPVICKDCSRSMSDVMFGDSNTKSRNTGDSTHSSSNKHRGRKRRKKEKKKKRKGRGRKRYRKGKEILFICTHYSIKFSLKAPLLLTPPITSYFHPLGHSHYILWLTDPGRGFSVVSEERKLKINTCLPNSVGRIFLLSKSCRRGRK